MRCLLRARIFRLPNHTLPKDPPNAPHPGLPPLLVWEGHRWDIVGTLLGLGSPHARSCEKILAALAP